jgi:hypothetical protein
MNTPYTSLKLHEIRLLDSGRYLETEKLKTWMLTTQMYFSSKELFKCAHWKLKIQYSIFTIYFETLYLGNGSYVTLQVVKKDSLTYSNYAFTYLSIYLLHTPCIILLNILNLFDWIFRLGIQAQAWTKIWIQGDADRLAQSFFREKAVSIRPANVSSVKTVWFKIQIM